MAQLDLKRALLVGPGYFGALIIEELLSYTTYDIIIAGRDEARLGRVCERFGAAGAARVTGRIADLAKPESLEPAVRDADIVICAAGPFQTLPLTLPRLCLRNGIPYIDLADDRRFVARVRHLVNEMPDGHEAQAICCGWSAVPALSAILARIAVESMEPVASIRIQIAPGNRLPRAVGTVASLLHSVGQPFTIWREGAPHKVSGWSQPRMFEFPPPVGRQIGYLVDAPDYDLFPNTFGAATVEFRVGAEIGLLNNIVRCLACLVRRGVVGSLVRHASTLRSGMALLGRLGHDWGAIGVEAQGMVEGREILRRACIVAAHEGHRIPVMPAVIVAQKHAECAFPFSGLVPCDAWLQHHELQAESDRRGYRLTVEAFPA